MRKKKLHPGHSKPDGVSAFHWPKAGGPTASGQYWSFKDAMEGAQIDLSNGNEAVEPVLFTTDHTQFRIYFDSELARMQAITFFGVAYHSMFEFIEFAPDFERVLVEFEANQGRQFTVGVLEGFVYFHIDLGDERGLLLQLHHPI